jgi:hypothetical protein
MLKATSSERVVPCSEALNVSTLYSLLAHGSLPAVGWAFTTAIGAIKAGGGSLPYEDSPDATAGSVAGLMPAAGAMQ